MIFFSVISNLPYIKTGYLHSKTVTRTHVAIYSLIYFLKISSNTEGKYRFKTIFLGPGPFCPRVPWNLESAHRRDWASWRVNCHFLFLDLPLWLLGVEGGQICTGLFTGCLCLGVDSVPKTAVTPLGLELKTRFQLILFPDPRTKFMKMGPFWLVVNLEDSAVEKYEFSSGLTVYCFSAACAMALPYAMEANLRHSQFINLIFSRWLLYPEVLRTFWLDFFMLPRMQRVKKRSTSRNVYFLAKNRSVSP